jgi:hypothetical protein
VALALYNSPKPFVAAINGSAVGFGLTLTLPMDIRICADNAKLGFVFSRRGMIIDAAASWFLPRIVAMSWAADWAYSGRMLSAGRSIARWARARTSPSRSGVARGRTQSRRDCRCQSGVVSFTKALLWRASTCRVTAARSRSSIRGVARARNPPRLCRRRAGVPRSPPPPNFTSKVSTDMPSVYRWWERDTEGG